MVCEMTEQEMFNKVWERAKIPVTSMAADNVTCGYRNRDGSGNHCFIGVCMPDEDYKPEFEGKGPNNNEIKSIFPKIRTKFMESVQAVHDDEAPDEWECKLRDIAEDYNLQIPA